MGDATANRVVPASGFTAALTTISAAAMAFLAVVTIALALASGELADRWEAELAGTATLRISAPADQIEAQVQAATTALAQTPGIESFRRLDADEQAELLAPWFGRELPVDSLRLPVLIAVNETDEGPDPEGLAQRLAAEAPGAVYDNHSRWRAPLIEAARWLREMGIAALVMIAGVTAVIVALAASAAMAANGQIVDVLRLVGARDRWITRAFVRRYTLRAFAGALGGTVLGLAALIAMPRGVETGVLSGIGLSGWEWLLALLVPLAAAGLAWAATHVAAARRLKRTS